MKIVIDNKIPFIQGVFEKVAEVVYAPGATIDSDMVHDADALIVRTRTQCNEALLSGSSVRFIATATIGYDHIDAQYCKTNNIKWVNSPGCNADAVVQYVFSALGHLAKRDSFDLSQLTLGVVGVGNVGSRVANFAERLGMTVLRNDPPRADREGQEGFVSFDQIKSESDIITFHTPLSMQGDHPTYHLFNSGILGDLAKTPIIINASRGEVCANDALVQAKTMSAVNALVIDCWEAEPAIDLTLLSLVDIATFHIAGYSLEGKANATTAVVRAVSSFFALGFGAWQVDLPPFTSPCSALQSLLDEVVCSYPIMADDQSMKSTPEKFEELRGSYDLRRQPLCI